MVKLLSLFSGIGAFEKALTNLEIPFELIAYCEFDKYALTLVSLSSPNLSNWSNACMTIC